jgi:hypothetical protein
MQITIDADTLTVAAQIELEEATATRQIVAWLVNYAGCNEAELMTLKLAQLSALGAQVQEQIKKAVAVPK